MIDYAAAEEFATIVRAFAITESDENPHATGDDGLAIGILQMHPADFVQFYGSHGSRFRPAVLDSWSTAQVKACAAFLALHRWFAHDAEWQDLIVQAWNQGEAGVFIDGRRAPEYLRRWKEAYAKIQPALE